MLTMIKDARLAADLTQTQLAKRLGTQQSFVSKYESGERRLDVLELREICQALGVRFDEFMARLDKVLR